jgi:UDP-N-acetylmuramoyl-L-alanyl-D-glutamate--2,6-diaminopimelate ligase
LRLSSLVKTTQNCDIKGITADSRLVREGYLFAALPGSRTDGAEYIQNAILNGAVAIIAKTGTTLPHGAHAVLIESDNPRLLLSQIAARFYAMQPENIVAVTGTSGKTSTVSFTQQLWNLSGIDNAASLGTLGVHGGGFSTYGSLTTPDTVSLHAALADLGAAGITHLAMEASSHGLDQYRLDGVRIQAAGYSNLSRDHLDYHETMEAYFRAKSRLFGEVLEKGGTAVLNADDDHYTPLRDIAEQSGRNVLSYGENGQDIKLLNRTLCPEGQSLSLEIFEKNYQVTLPLVGKFQVQNALCALGLVLSLDRVPERYVPLLAGLRGVPGRLELVAGHPKNAAVYVDYAHKPAAVEAVLNTLRPHTKSRLFCVIGCGGNRDAGKRPIMGRIAAGLADVVIITDDNPRHEDPAVIRAAMMEGAPDAKEIGNRKEAIEYAIQKMEDGDVLVIAGKGHEQGQIIGDDVHPFDDVAEAKTAIRNLQENV